MDNQDRNRNKYMLAFLSLCETLSRDGYIGAIPAGARGLNERSTGYIGAILVTDERGVPQEFRCTYPVKPTMVQRVLYGDSLKSYIGVELCGIPLINSLQSSPSLFVVSEEFLLDVKKAISYPVICVYKAGDVMDLSLSDMPEVGFVSKTHLDSIVPENQGLALKKEKINCPNGRFQPIAISSPNIEGDIADAKKIIEDVFQYFNPLEPFERILKAIEIITRQDKRFQ